MIGGNYPNSDNVPSRPMCSPGAGGFGQQQWDFHSQVDPEELFRKIFGDFGQRGGGFGGDFDQNFEESRYGFGASQEASFIYGLLLHEYMQQTTRI